MPESLQDSRPREGTGANAETFLLRLLALVRFSAALVCIRECIYIYAHVITIRLHAFAVSMNQALQM